MIWYIGYTGMQALWTWYQSSTIHWNTNRDTWSNWHCQILCLVKYMLWFVFFFFFFLVCNFDTRIYVLGIHLKITITFWISETWINNREVQVACLLWNHLLSFVHSTSFWYTMIVKKLNNRVELALLAHQLFSVYSGSKDKIRGRHKLKSGGA